jgi:hypothetical protein
VEWHKAVGLKVESTRSFLAEKEMCSNNQPFVIGTVLKG